MLAAESLQTLANILAKKDPQMLLGHVETEISAIDRRAEDSIRAFEALITAQVEIDKQELLVLKEALMGEFTNKPVETVIPITSNHPSPDNGFIGL